MTLSRDLIQLTGPDTAGLLQGLFTNDVNWVEINSVQHTALLTPQGKIVDTMFLWRTAEAEFVIDVAMGRGDGLAKKLKLYRLRAAVNIDPLAAAVGCGPPPADTITVAQDPRHSDLPVRWLAPNEIADATNDDTLYREEIRLGIPAFGTAYQENDAFPLGVNLDLLHGIDHHKGCFVGQEVASRMFRKGDIRKRTWRATGAGLKVCDEVMADDRTVAMITAVDGENGLALVRLDRIGDTQNIEATTPAGETIRLIKPDYLP